MDNEQLIIKGRENVLKDKSYHFALKIISLCQRLQAENEYILSRQLLRSGTSVGALIEEANQAESRADFIHKLSIANKEANESKYWIRLLIDSKIIELKNDEGLLTDCVE
ncbi:MAG: four helix bundle protein [Cyclobacteriaceae bacterium]|nr:four helix bundle protein [Cyclobacteriaceae bacterium]